MTEPRVDFDALKRRIIDSNARLIDNTFEAYTKGQSARKEEFVTLWKASFDRVTDPEALRDGSDGMLLNGILMEAILKGEVKSDFADWVFPGERARKLARALEEMVRVGGVVPRYNRRDMPSAIEAYRAKRPKVGGSFSARLSASLAEDAGDVVEDWVHGRGDWAPYVARGDRTTSVFSDIKKGDDAQPTSIADQIIELERDQQAAVTAKQFATAADIETQIAQLKAQATQQGPSLVDQIMALEAEQEAAVATKQYGRAAELQDQIEQMQAQTSSSVVDVSAIQARIAELERDQQAAVTAKQFATAADIETQIAQLKAQATQQGPSLVDQIMALEAEQEAAVATKQYGRAAELQDQISALTAEHVHVVLRGSAIVVTPTTTVINGPAAGDATSLEAKREEVVALVATKKFRMEETRTGFLQKIYSSKNMAELEAVRGQVAAMP